MVDIGMRYMLLGTRGTDVGHILENVIYLELKRRGYEVYVGKPDELEVEFDTGRRPGGGLRGHPPHQCTGLADGDGTMTGKALARLVFRKQFFPLLKNCSWNADISCIWKERNCCFRQDMLFGMIYFITAGCFS